MGFSPVISLYSLTVIARTCTTAIRVLVLHLHTHSHLIRLCTPHQLSTCSDCSPPPKTIVVPHTTPPSCMLKELRVLRGGFTPPDRIENRTPPVLVCLKPGSRNDSRSRQEKDSEIPTRAQGVLRGCGGTHSLHAAFVGASKFSMPCVGKYYAIILNWCNPHSPRNGIFRDGLG